MAVFRPTGTSQLLIRATKPYIHKGKLLDLGCGCGIVGSSFLEQSKVYASDVSLYAVEFVKHYYPAIETRCGSLFDCWEGEKFDYVVDDVSGICEEIAKVSPWFEDVPCDSGIDGTDLIRKVLQQAPGYLAPHGKLFFPIVSLSNKLRVVQTAVENFNCVEKIATEHFPLPKEMYKHLDLMKNLKLQGYIDYRDAFGGIIFWTDIYIAYNV